MNTLSSSNDPDQCGPESAGFSDWNEIARARASFSSVARLLDAALGAGGVTACTWRLVILHRSFLPGLTPAQRQAEILRVIRLYDVAGAGDASHTLRNLKREILRTAATFATTAPTAAWALAVTALRTQFDPNALQWAMLAIHFVLADSTARTSISMTERNAALVELGRIATASVDSSAPALAKEPATFDAVDPIPTTWYVGGREWAHRYGRVAVAMAGMYYGTWKHLIGKPCDPTLPADDLRSIFQCYPDLAPPSRPGQPAPPNPVAAARPSRAVEVFRAAKKPVLVVVGLSAVSLLGAALRQRA